MSHPLKTSEYDERKFKSVCHQRDEKPILWDSVGTQHQIACPLHPSWTFLSRSTIFYMSSSACSHFKQPHPLHFSRSSTSASDSSARQMLDHDWKSLQVLL